VARKRNGALNEAAVLAIKQHARQLMAEEGTAGLSIRGIAKMMEVTPPAIYHYFASLEDLITTLIAEDFNGLADALEAARDASSAATAGGKLLEVVVAYRQWALDHPVDFQLIYGNPIPGYAAPREVTVPAVVRTFVTPVALIETALQSGELIPQPPYDAIPPEVEAHLHQLITEGGYPIQTLSMHLAMVMWTQLHGIIMLELYNHLEPNVGSVESFYRHVMTGLLRSMGLRSI
jgi:AcrR family transcriptional regulator